MQKFLFIQPQVSLEVKENRNQQQQNDHRPPCCFVIFTWFTNPAADMFVEGDAARKNKTGPPCL